MHKIIYSPSSLKDLQEIKDFIQKDNPYYAWKVIETIFFFVNMLSIFPLIWKESNSKSWFREITEPTFRYKIIYWFDWKDIYISTIFKYKNI